MIASFEICSCPCHVHTDIKHCVPCCAICPNCGQNIATGYMEQHLEHCRNKEIK